MDWKTLEFHNAIQRVPALDYTFLTIWQDSSLLFVFKKFRSTTHRYRTCNDVEQSIQSKPAASLFQGVVDLFIKKCVFLFSSSSFLSINCAIDVDHWTLSWIFHHQTDDTLTRYFNKNKKQSLAQQDPAKKIEEIVGRDETISMQMQSASRSLDVGRCNLLANRLISVFAWMKPMG